MTAAPAIQDVWPPAAGTVWIYKCDTKSAEGTGTVQHHFRWTHVIEWAAANEQHHVAITQDSPPAFEESQPSTSRTLMIAESDHIVELEVDNEVAAYRIAAQLLDENLPIDRRAKDVVSDLLAEPEA